MADPVIHQIFQATEPSAEYKTVILDERGKY